MEDFLSASLSLSLLSASVSAETSVGFHKSREVKDGKSFECPCKGVPSLLYRLWSSLKQMDIALLPPGFLVNSENPRERVVTEEDVGTSMEREDLTSGLQIGFLFNFSCRIVDLQYCVSFRCRESDSVIHVHTYILFQILFPFKLL